MGDGGTRSEAEYLEANVSETRPFPPYSWSVVSALVSQFRIPRSAFRVWAVPHLQRPVAIVTLFCRILRFLL